MRKHPNSPWARLHVVRGDGPQRIAFAAKVPARVTVGSAPDADLCLRGPDVAPRHFQVVWDGENLWLEDPLRLGRTFVNGHLLNGWVVVLGQVVISFGNTRLWVLAEGTPPTANTPNFASLERARVYLNPGADDRRRNTARLTFPPELTNTWHEREGVA